MVKEGNPISVGQASKKYGVPKQTLSRYADQGKVVTLVMPGSRGQARMLDEMSVYRLVSRRLESKPKVKAGKSLVHGSIPVYRKDEGIGLDAMDVAREYLRHCKNKGIAKTSYGVCERIVMGFAQRYDDLPFRGEEVQSYINGMEVAQTSKKTYFSWMRNFYNWVEVMYDIATPIRRGMGIIAKKQLPRAFDVSEVEMLLGVIEDDQDKVMVNTFMATGIRRGELVNLDREDVFPSHIHIKGIEGNKTGEANVAIPEWLYEQLISLRDGEGYLFADCRGGRLSAQAVTNRMARYMDKAGIKGKRRGPHTLRHTAGCNLLESTGDLDFVRQVLRHTDIAQTLVYAQLRPTSVEEKYQKVMSDQGDGDGEFRFAKFESKKKVKESGQDLYL